MTLTVGSLFSGVGGFDLGFERAGCEVRWLCEIDRDCRDVLCRHFDAPEGIFCDVRTIPTHLLAPVDIIIGGFPCQDVSVAGKRAGLAGGRTGLFYDMCRVIRAVRPAFAVFENVPGLLNSGEGRDFAAVLRTLRDIGAVDIAWSVLDAQWWGVPQRRRRVFIVCDFGGERAAEILALAEGLSGHPPPRREKGQRTTGSLADCSGERGWSSSVDCQMWVETAHALSAEGADASEDGTERTRKDGRTFEMQEDLAYALTNPGSGGRTHSRQIMDAMGVRRLMPVECERLQGWPDGWTALGASGKEMSDSTRYRQIGNGVATPVAEWIARRIVEVAS